MRKNKILITGSEGFIGSHLSEKLLKEGYHVKALVQYNSFSNYGWLEEIENYKKKNIEIIMGDVRDSDSIRNIVKGCDAIIHLAALIAIPYSYKSPQSYIDTNITGTLNLLQSARDLNVDTFIHTSTSEVYGTANYVPIDENHPLQGQSPYSASKIGADQIALAFYNSFDMPINIIRPFNTYGPRQSARAIIPTIISQLANNQAKLSIGSLAPTRDFLFIKDTVNAFFHAIKFSKKYGEVINIGSGFEISMKDLLNLLIKKMDKEVKIKIEKNRLRPDKSEVNRLLCNNKKAKKIIKWAPKYSGLKGLKKGLDDTIKWYSTPENLRKFKSKIYNI